MSDAALAATPGAPLVHVDALGDATTVTPLSAPRLLDYQIDSSVVSTSSSSQAYVVYSSPYRRWGWITGGIGVASLAVGGIFGALTLSAKSTVNDGCNATTRTCTQDAHDAANSGKIYGPITTVGLVVGAIGVTTGIVLLSTRPRRYGSVTMTTGLVASPGGGALKLEGSL